MGSPKLSRRSLLSALSLLPAVRLRGQEQKSQDPAFSTDVKVVNLFANVRDKKGQIVKSLSRNDFLLDEDGRPQAIRYFSQESNLPLTLGLLVDTSGSTRGVLADERVASEQFLMQVLRPEKDLAFLIHFDFEVELLQDLTGSREKLEKALGQLQTGQFQRRASNGPYGGGGGRGRRGGYPGGGGGRRGGGGTLLYDSVYLAADELMRKQTGRKALILLSDGEDNGSKISLLNTIESAQRADTLVFGILFEDPSMAGLGTFTRRGGFGGMNRPDGRKVMDQICRQTGGRFFEVSRKRSITQIFSDIEEDLRNQYSLGYSPDRPAHAGEYRKIHLTTRQKGLIVQTREGYYPS
jgi:VWFA-related protein